MHYKQIRYLIIIGCLSLIVLRIIVPDLKFDTISMTLLGVAVLATLIPDVDKILSKTKKLKLGSIEWELNELNKSTEKVENELKDEKLKEAGISGLTHRYDFNFELQNDLPTTILKLSIEIERTLREIYILVFKTREERPLATSKLIDILRNEKIIDPDTAGLLRQFWQTRNHVVHGHNSIAVTEKDMLAFSDIGIRLLKILKTLENNLSDGKVKISQLS